MQTATISQSSVPDDSGIDPGRQRDRRRYLPLQVGRDVILKMNKKPAEFGDTLLKVTDLTYENKEGRKLLAMSPFH